MGPAHARAARLPVAIWTLGFVSLLMDVSSELIHSLLPVFLVSSLAASAFTVGLIEGAAQATALIVKLFSGVWSDRLGRRKPLALLGYGLGALAKPLFALAPGVGWVFGARMIDRVGKGIRGAPRDALLAELAPEARRGASFGLRQALDTVGALLGPLLAVVLMAWWGGDVRAVFWVAVIPAALSVALLAFGVSEPERVSAAPGRCETTDAPPRGAASTSERGGALTSPGTGAAAAVPSGVDRLPARGIGWTAVRRLPAACWRVVAVGAMFTLARFSEAFLLLRAQQGGLALTLVPLVLVTMNAVYAASAYPFGHLADRVDRRRLLAAALAVLVVADMVLASSAQVAVVAAGAALWGLHMGMSQGLLAAMVADSAPADAIGTAYGVFNLACGLALLFASASAGWLWDRFGAEFTFLVAAAWALLACVALVGLRGSAGSTGSAGAGGDGMQA
jgi:MFS family permease